MNKKEFLEKYGEFSIIPSYGSHSLRANWKEEMSKDLDEIMPPSKHSQSFVLDLEEKSDQPHIDVHFKATTFCRHAKTRTVIDYQQGGKPKMKVSVCYNCGVTIVDEAIEV
jgi:hypothetical protein